MNGLIGQLIDHYRIDLLLGEGGMGAVYRAHDMNLDIPVALKVMHRHLSSQQEFQERFMQEARAEARLDHPSIVTVKYFGMSQGLLYMVMNFVPGDSLSTFIRKVEATGQIFQLKETLIRIAQVADALGYAHQQGVVHRDVKPTNVMVQKLEKPNREGEPALRAIVTDFGLAKLLVGGIETQSGAFLGTLPYMSPEQCLSEPLDGRSDIYSLGVMLYQLTTGKLPFDIKTPSEAVMKHLHEIPPSPRTIWPGLPMSVEEIIQKAIAKQTMDRYQHAEAVAEDLRSAVNRLTEAEITNYIAHRTVLDLGTSLEQMSRVPEPSRIGIDEPFTSVGDRLIIAQKDHTPRTVRLDKSQLIIGRSSANDIVLDHPDISRQHLRLELTSNGWQVTDLGSSNGSYLERNKLLAGIPEALQPGKTLRIGPYFIHWQAAGSAITGGMIDESVKSIAPATSITRMQSTTGNTYVQATPTELDVEAGTRTELQVELSNQSVQVDHFKLNIEELPSSWVTVPPEPVRLMPGAEVSLPIVIHPPRDNTARARTYLYKLIVNSISNPQETVEIQGHVTVHRFERFSVDELQPTRLKSGGTSRVTIHNDGNTEDQYSVSGHDPIEAVQFDGTRNDIRIVPGRQKTIELKVTAKKQLSVGINKTLPFEIQVESTSGVQAKKTGQLDVRPAVPSWILPLIGILLVICLLGSGFGYFGIIVPNSQTSEAQTATFNAEKVIAAQSATQAAIETANTVTFTVTTTMTTTPTLTATATSTLSSTPIPPPNANILTNKTNGGKPLTIQFIDQSSGDITSRIWDFGDGSISADKDPTHIFTTIGEFNVRLTVKGPGGEDTAQTKISTIITPSFHGTMSFGISGSDAEKVAADIDMAFSQWISNNPVHPNLNQEVALESAIIITYIQSGELDVAIVSADTISRLLVTVFMPLDDLINLSMYDGNSLAQVQLGGKTYGIPYDGKYIVIVSGREDDLLDAIINFVAYLTVNY